jgi:Predicted protease with the C-terminal PDZ domain
VGDVLHELLERTDGGTRPYTWADIQSALEQVAPDDWAAFERRYIHGTEPLPIDDALARVGLRIAQGADSAIRIEPDPTAPARVETLRRAVTGEPH